MALSTIPQPTGSTGQAPAIQPEQPRGRTVRERFNALTARQRDEILDRYRDFNVEHVEWWDSVYALFESDMEAIGIEVDRMYFSGFWSQGDGACFEGRVCNWANFLPTLGYTCPALINHATEHFEFSVKQDGRYYHENCTSFSGDLPLPAHDEDRNFAHNYLYRLEEDSVQEAVAMALLNQYSEVVFEERFTEAFKDHMRELYKRLEAEYEYLTSDEAILYSLEVNDQLEDAINSITEEAYA